MEVAPMPPQWAPLPLDGTREVGQLPTLNMLPSPRGSCLPWLDPAPWDEANILPSTLDS
jgi:hypothetical protein